jgi:hypothetical protein
MAATIILLVHDGLSGDRVSSRHRIKRARSGRLVHQVQDFSTRVPGCQVYTIRAEGVEDGQIVTLTLIERGFDCSKAA